MLVNGGPLLVAGEAGRHATTAAGLVFAATMIVRAPVYVFQGLAASLLANLTHLNATADTARCVPRSLASPPSCSGPGP